MSDPRQPQQTPQPGLAVRFMHLIDSLLAPDAAPPRHRYPAPPKSQVDPVAQAAADAMLAQEEAVRAYREDPTANGNDLWNAAEALAEKRRALAFRTGNGPAR